MPLLLTSTPTPAPLLFLSVAKAGTATVTADDLLPRRAITVEPHRLARAAIRLRQCRILQPPLLFRRCSGSGPLGDRDSRVVTTATAATAASSFLRQRSSTMTTDDWGLGIGDL
uniref:Uncharacterized protein n=1 Tax=Oryza punctata TaxID=4537 RepID=A0A0E0KXU8_ORYPU